MDEARLLLWVMCLLNFHCVENSLEDIFEFRVEWSSFEFGGNSIPIRLIHFFGQGGPSLCLWRVGLKSSPLSLWILLRKKFQTVIAETATNSNLDAGCWHRGARSMLDRLIFWYGPTMFRCYSAKRCHGESLRCTQAKSIVFTVLTGP